jgi:ankyrin repeat protein
MSTTSPFKDPPNTSSLHPAALDLATKLFNLARTGSTPTLLSYLQAGIPTDLTNAQGDTLLMLAAYHGNVETTKMLLEEGADPNILNGKGQSVIAGAVFKGWDEVVEVLLEGGADVRGGRPSAVECARMFGRGDLVEMFEGRTEGRVGSEDGGRNIL